MRVETYCGGRLRKVTGQVEVPGFGGEPFPDAEAAAEHARQYRAAHDVPVVDGQWFWELDGQRVTDDVAQAMLARRPD